MFARLEWCSQRTEAVHQTGSFSRILAGFKPDACTAQIVPRRAHTCMWGTELKQRTSAGQWLCRRAHRATERAGQGATLRRRRLLCTPEEEGLQQPAAGRCVLGLCIRRLRLSHDIDVDTSACRGLLLGLVSPGGQSRHRRRRPVGGHLGRRRRRRRCVCGASVVLEFVVRVVGVVQDDALGGQVAHEHLRHLLVRCRIWGGTGSVSVKLKTIQQDVGGDTECVC